MAKYTPDMFTGIIKELGKVKKITKSAKGATFVIQAKSILKNKKIGESIAVNGVCVTITKLTKGNFEFEAIKETLDISNLKSLEIDDEVNLEPALTLNQSLDGHLVQGHIDTEGTVENYNENTLTIKFPKQISDCLAFKGSITVNGVSLTISDLQDSTFSVSLIPHTLKNTNLKNLKKGDKVNLEVDLIARYLKNLLDKKDNEAKYEFLKDRNLI